MDDHFWGAGMFVSSVHVTPESADVQMLLSSTMAASLFPLPTARAGDVPPFLGNPSACVGRPQVNKENGDVPTAHPAHPPRFCGFILSYLEHMF
jgi:hypothetical protein